MRTRRPPRGVQETARTEITVQTYSGYRGDERPVSFSCGGWTWRVVEILDRWYDPDYDGFRVLAEDGGTFLLRHDLNTGRWEIVPRITATHEP